MNITVKIDLATPSEPGIFRAKTYGDPFMVAKMGLSTEILKTSNFQNIDLFTPADDFKSVSVFQRMGKPELDYLMQIQPVDAGSFNSKMSFLCSERRTPPDRPYWTRGGTWQDMASGNIPTVLEFGTLVFGGQLVKVETVNGVPQVYTFVTNYQSEDDIAAHPINFYKLVGMRRVDMGRYTHTSHPWFIQRCTWATYPDNRYKDTWNSGVVYHPVWSPLDYPAINGSRDLYIACDFVTN